VPGIKKSRPNCAIFDHCKIRGEVGKMTRSQFYQFSLRPNFRYTFDGVLLGCLGDQRSGVRKAHPVNISLKIVLLSSGVLKSRLCNKPRHCSISTFFNTGHKIQRIAKECTTNSILQQTRHNFHNTFNSKL